MVIDLWSHKGRKHCQKRAKSIKCQEFKAKILHQEKNIYLVKLNKNSFENIKVPDFCPVWMTLSEGHRLLVLRGFVVQCLREVGSMHSEFIGLSRLESPFEWTTELCQYIGRYLSLEGRAWPSKEWDSVANDLLTPGFSLSMATLATNMTSMY